VRAEIDVWERAPSEARQVTLPPLDGSTPTLPALKSWIIPPRRIGGRTYQGECVLARVRHATYQQQSTTFGRTAGVFGLSTNGNGLVTGGGGFIDTVHQGIVSLVLEDAAGRHVTQELPATVAALENGMVRLDLIDGRLIAATNLSGRQRPILLLGPAAFIEAPSFTRRDGALLLAALVSAGQFLAHPLVATALTVVFGLVPGLRLRRMSIVRRRRSEFGDYMTEVMS
jgi:hypothetical protein